MDLIQTAQDIGLLSAVIWTAAINFLPRLGAAFVVAILGYLLARFAGDRVEKFVRTSPKIDTTLAVALGGAIRYGLLVVVAVAALGQVGIQTTSILAVIGAAGLAIGLALQGTLSNIAAGIMLLWLRPFRVGDFIETDTVAGTVREIGLFATQIDTYDGIFRFVPNASLWNKAVSNKTRNPARMTDIAIGVAYDTDIEEARRIMLDIAHADERVRPEPAPEVFINGFGDNAVELRYRVWIRTHDFWAGQRSLIEKTKRQLDAAGIEMPFPQRVVRILRDGSNRSAA